MDTLLNIALLLIGSASTLAAFGGKTWKEGEEPVIERITVRGWISIGCLTVALAIGIAKEIHTRNLNRATAAANQLAAIQAKADAERRQAELQNQLTKTQGQLDVANTKLSDANGRLIDLKGQLRFTEDQITGGNGFPIAIIFPQFPDQDGSFPLQVSVQGHAPLFDVTYSISEGAYKRPSPEEVGRLIANGIATIYGHGPSSEKHLGLLDPDLIVPLGYVIRPKAETINVYRIAFQARNRAVMETLDVRFNRDLKIWQFRYSVEGDDPRHPNTPLAKSDWIPKKNFPILYGEGPPH